MPTERHQMSSELQSVTSIFQSMQKNISEQLTKVCNKLDDVSERIDDLEDRQRSFENKIGQSSQSVSPAVPGKRRRVTPAALQVRNSELIQSLSDQILCTIE